MGSQALPTVLRVVDEKGDATALSHQPMYALAKSLHNFGKTLIMDDIEDIGYFEYYGRKTHYYHGVQSADHPSPFHHWQWGGALVFVSQILGTYAVWKEMSRPDEDDVPALPSFSALAEV